MLKHFSLLSNKKAISSIVTVLAVDCVEWPQTTIDTLVWKLVPSSSCLWTKIYKNRIQLHAQYISRVLTRVELGPKQQFIYYFSLILFPQSPAARQSILTNSPLLFLILMRVGPVRFGWLHPVSLCVAWWCVRQHIEEWLIKSSGRLWITFAVIVHQRDKVGQID